MKSLSMTSCPHMTQLNKPTAATAIAQELTTVIKENMSRNADHHSTTVEEIRLSTRFAEGGGGYGELNVRESSPS